VTAPSTAESAFLALQRDAKRWAAWCAQVRKEWLEKRIAAAAVKLVAVCIVLLAGCSGDAGGLLLLDHEELREPYRYCVYADYPQDFVLTIRSWQQCEESIAVD
jgi:hypothetical protein